ncbi:MAG: hypothetical protein JXR77_00870 [Lentisphaeria bacterium]|nr:hypothetical protein [Lentisphaeria bacterium]
MVGNPFPGGLTMLAAVAGARDADAVREIVCGGTYPAHLQGVSATAGLDGFYWSFTRDLLRTDRNGAVQAAVKVPGHHGDLTWHNGKVYVAVNLGAFNQPAGKADSHVYVYADDDLRLLGKHAVPELVHGAGGMACDGSRFIVIGGLPKGIEENYAYEYDLELRFVKRHVIPSGYTHLGIQTACYADGSWRFGCYGGALLHTDGSFRLLGRYPFDAAYGLIPVAEDLFLVARHIEPKWRAKLVPCQADATNGLREGPVQPPAAVP